MSNDVVGQYELDGSSLDILSSEFSRNPFAQYDRMRDSAPISPVNPGGMLGIYRYVDAQYVLRHYSMFSSQGFLDQIYRPSWMRPECWRELPVLTDDPPVHTSRRATINKAFVTGVVNKLIPTLRQIAREKLESSRRKQRFEFISDFAYSYAGSIIGELTGLTEHQDIAEIKTWLEMMESITPTRPSDVEKSRIENSILHQYAIFRRIISESRDNPRNDLVSAIVRAQAQDNSMPEDALPKLMELLLGAGLQTTVHLLSNMMMQLSEAPELFRRLKHNPDLIPMFIEEQLRFDPPTHRILRQSVVDVEVSGLVIPKGTLIVIMLASANRDPEKFTSPDKFDITRSNAREHISFGYGPHACVGAALARAEARVALEEIIDRSERIMCPPKDQLDWVRSITTHGVRELPIILD